MSVETDIDERIGEIRFEAIDFSFGELLNLRTNSEIVIDPEYQRLFRWSNEQRSRLIESVLLGLPLPQIFMVENADGVLELIDGLQRVSSVLQFIDHEALQLDELSLSGCDLVPSLNGTKYSDMELSLKLKVKRSPIRAVIIKRQSKGFIKYEMFKRLNTGGSALSSQEVRNCSLRMIDGGAEFYSWLQDLANIGSFTSSISTLSDSDREQKSDEELVVRYFALKHGRNLFKGSVRDWLDNYLESLLLGGVEIDRHSEREIFERVFSFIFECMGEYAFVKYRDGRPIGALAPAFFEAVTMGFLNNIDGFDALVTKDVNARVIAALESQDFKDQTGPGANSRPKMERRIQIISEAVAG
jgi:Protein of unknown function DUF262